MVPSVTKLSLQFIASFCLALLLIIKYLPALGCISQEARTAIHHIGCLLPSWFNIILPWWLVWTAKYSVLASLHFLHKDISFFLEGRQKSLQIVLIWKCHCARQNSDGASQNISRFLKWIFKFFFLIFFIRLALDFCYFAVSSPIDAPVPLFCIWKMLWRKPATQTMFTGAGSWREAGVNDWACSPAAQPITVTLTIECCMPSNI